MNLLNLTGKRFGRLTAVKCEGIDAHGKRKWLFICDCGDSIVTVGSSAKSGKVKSCGCLKAEVARHNAVVGARKISISRTKHGFHGIPEYFVWKSMRQRCNNPQSRDYPNYGGRCISVCKRWDDFERFLTDMGFRPTEQHSLDRIDNDCGYSPGNCRWADATTQRLNQRRMKHGNRTLIACPRGRFKTAQDLGLRSCGRG